MPFRTRESEVKTTAILYSGFKDPSPVDSEDISQSELDYLDLVLRQLRHPSVSLVPLPLRTIDGKHRAFGIGITTRSEIEAAEEDKTILEIPILAVIPLSTAELFTAVGDQTRVVEKIHE